MKVSTENDNNFGYEKITIVVDNIPLRHIYNSFIVESYIVNLVETEVHVILLNKYSFIQLKLVVSFHSTTSIYVYIYILLFISFHSYIRKYTQILYFQNIEYISD